MMSTLTKLFRASAVPEMKSSRTAQLIAFQSQARARWTPRDTAALAREGYMKNAIVHRAVRLVAETVASVTWLGYDGDAEHHDHVSTDARAGRDGIYPPSSCFASLQLLAPFTGAVGKIPHQRPALERETGA